MSRPTRRQFLQTSLAFGAGVVIAGTKSSGKVLGANDRIRIGVAGLKGRGSAHVGGYVGLKNVEITYLIDPDQTTWAAREKTVRDQGGNQPKLVQDVREALDDKNLDAISIATPNHWHSLMTIWACQAGKDVYVEKPSSHNIFEGRQTIEAARKYNRIVQHGTQNRSSAGWARVVELIRSGKYGKLLVAKGYCYKPRGSIGFKPVEPVPSTLNYDLWLGPAPELAFHRNLVHYNWHWFWETGNGDIGNQGVHQMDIARWGIPGAKLPQSVFSLGGRFGYEDQGVTPNTQVAVFDYGDTKLVFEVRGLKAERKVTNEFYTTEGKLTADKFYPRGKSEGEPLPRIEVQMGPGGGNHFANFIEAVRSRKQDDLNSEITEGHYSSALCHLANISYRLGEQVPVQSAANAFRGDKVALETWQDTLQHLEKENGLKLAGLNCWLGPQLKIDQQAERFIDNERANQMLTRDYRKPYVVPEKV